MIMAISLLYTSYIVKQLQEDERNKVTLFVRALEQINVQFDQQNLNEDLTLQTEVVKLVRNIPIVMVDETGRTLTGHNFDVEKDTSQVFLRKELSKLIAAGGTPIDGSGGYHDKIYYKQSRLTTLLSYFPLLQVLLFMAYIAIGYVGFSSSRRAEQNRVWVGMAKETAHQLGTPISAIIAWIEYLKQMYDGNEATQEVLVELNKDVGRLNLIADRFSKIGSAPELKKTNLVSEIQASCIYMKRRASRKVEFIYPDEHHHALYAMVNPQLFQWVLENLLRNALDAMSNEGQITISMSGLDNQIEMLVSDTGTGIPSNKLKTVFRPGYSTKKRGWGLGLSLAKRIIVEYHGGRIFVKNSEIGKGSTFAIVLPRSS